MEAAPQHRKLKIEADGDGWLGSVKPKIRLTGKWLERAGFNPGSHVEVICHAPGIIELRADTNLDTGSVNPDSEKYSKTALNCDPISVNL